MLEAARVLFNRLRTEPDLQALIDEQEPETLHLDFKESPTNPSANQIRERDALLAKALSGFANSDGGVLILGVADNPRELRPIQDLVAFDQRVNELLSRVVSFPVLGAETRRIDARAGGGSGYLVVLIPASDLAPHRSQKDHRYYFRTGDSFLPMEHWQVADAFGRRHRPVLHLHIRLGTARQGERVSEILAWVGVKNVGRGLARFPAVDFGRRDGLFRWDEEEQARMFTGGIGPSMADDPAHFRGSANDVIHGGDVLQLLALRATVPQDGFFDLPEDFALSVSARLAAEGFPWAERRVSLTKQDLNNLLAGHTTTCRCTDFESA